MKYPKRSQYKYAKSQSRVRNWAEYEAGLQRRGDLTVWLSDAALDAWRAPASGKPGGQRRYADVAIEAALTIIGRCMRSRTVEAQRAEVRLACGILNTMTHLGMPDSYRVE